MTSAFKQGLMDKLAEISSPEDLDAFYKKLKYRVLNKDTNRPYFNTNREAFDSLTADRISGIAKSAQAYEPPWTIDQIRKNLGDEVADSLENDPVHKWRSDTGIELVHMEPTREELERIIMNWKLMDYLQKRKSNKKSKELFGLTNLQHAKELLEQYV